MQDYPNLRWSLKEKEDFVDELLIAFRYDIHTIIELDRLIGGLRDKGCENVSKKMLETLPKSGNPDLRRFIYSKIAELRSATHFSKLEFTTKFITEDNKPSPDLIIAKNNFQYSVEVTSLIESAIDDVIRYYINDSLIDYPINILIVLNTQLSKPYIVGSERREQIRLGKRLAVQFVGIIKSLPASSLKHEEKISLDDTIFKIYPGNPNNWDKCVIIHNSVQGPTIFI